MSSDGSELINFSSNDYLGLANHPDITKALKKGAEKYGTGSGASHLISGHSAAHQALEEQLAEFTGRPRTILYSNGYMANLGVLSALLSRNDLILSDELNHASLIDGSRLSRASCIRYNHADSNDLCRKLSSSEFDHCVVTTDGVFSMDGDIAPLGEITRICSEHGAWLMVDDAHGIGVLGAKGAGSLDLLGLDREQVPILVGTLGKSIGTYGAFVAGSDALIESLVQFSRNYIYTTALPAALAVATSKSLMILKSEDWRRERLHRNIAFFRSRASAAGLRLSDSETPIQPILVGDDERVSTLGNHLLRKGFLVGAIRPPTVPVGTGRLRISISAEHNETQLEALVDALLIVEANN